MCFFFINTTSTTQIYTLSLHDALPISWVHPDDRRTAQFVHPSRHTDPRCPPACNRQPPPGISPTPALPYPVQSDRKSTRLNSSHQIISYAVFCLKKKSRSRHREDVNSS